MIESQKIEFKESWKKPFNPIIANVFYKAGFIENWGRGTLNIIDECISYGLPKPTFEYEWAAVKVTFYKPKNNVGINEGINVGINVGINELYKFIEKNQPVRISYIKEYFNQVSTRTLERWIKKLKDEDKIEYIGSKKTGGYYIKNGAKK